MRIKAILAAIPILLLSCGSSDKEEYIPVEPKNPGGETEEVVYHERAKALYDAINQYYRISTGATAGFYNENYPKKTGDLAASYLWGYDGLVSGVATLHALGYNVDYEAMVNRFQAYWRSSAGQVNIGGYGSQTNGTSGAGTRFYDDNSIVGLDLVEAYRLTKKQVYLDRCKQIVAFLKTGEDNVLGGALWWNEDQKNLPGVSDSNKPACSNGYATNFLLKYYEVCPPAEKPDVLAFAKRLYNWLVANLRDPADNCYWNDRNADGSINKTKWTYNTGVMISNSVCLHRITGEQVYRDNAIASAEGAYNFFVRPAGGLALAYPDHDPWFTIKLVRAFIEIKPYHRAAESYVNTFVTFLNYAYDHARSSNGLYYENWTGTANPARDAGLLMQAAALESLGAIALYKGEGLSK